MFSGAKYQEGDKAEAKSTDDQPLPDLNPSFLKLKAKEKR